MGFKRLESRKIMTRIDEVCSRLNPGLFAVVVILSTVLLCETATRIIATEQEMMAQGLAWGIEPTAFFPAD